jgi:hypothetical protein
MGTNTIIYVNHCFNSLVNNIKYYLTGHDGGDNDQINNVRIMERYIKFKENTDTETNKKSLISSNRLYLLKKNKDEKNVKIGEAFFYNSETYPFIPKSFDVYIDKPDKDPDENGIPVPKEKQGSYENTTEITSPMSDLEINTYKIIWKRKE